MSMDLTPGRNYPYHFIYKCLCRNILSIVILSVVKANERKLIFKEGVNDLDFHTKSNRALYNLTIRIRT